MKRLLLGVVIGAIALFAYQRSNRPQVSLLGIEVLRRGRLFCSELPGHQDGWRPRRQALRRLVRPLSASIRGMNLRLHIAAALSLLPLAASADETFRCGKWIASSAMTVPELTQKCGEPTSRTS